MNVNTYNQKGEKIGQVKLPKEIFEKDFNPDLIHQVVVSMQSNKRQVTAHTKNKGEVRGGGRKPWRQKGTGRARHGSSRSPIWKGGGITFGPRNDRNYKKVIPKNMRRAALFSALSAKANDNEILVIDKISIEEPKTKILYNLLNNLLKKMKKEALKSSLIVVPKKDDVLLKAIKNIPGVELIEARNLNILDILSFKYLILSEESIKTIKDTFLK
ncbi:MAG: 50S ribosomal protein L4 [Patescibacteria group bacterium]|nr:50S ribosomal protein L4 [Patescibacteria group bacterium]